MISQKRLAANLAALEKITAAGPGINRLAFSDSDWQGRAFIIALMEAAGLTIRTDAFGNVIGRRAGSQPDLPAIMFGSHADSVPSGGNFDGVVGILSAIEVIQSLNEAAYQTEHPLEVVLFMAEESSRFGTATLGSKAMMGQLTVEKLQQLKDKDGHSLHEVLAARGLKPDAVANAKYAEEIKAFFEVHIEQGKVLEHEQKQLGIVTGIAAPTRLKLRLHGQADHSGATPMPLRHDGLCAAAEIILQVEALAAAEKDPAVVGTVGVVRVQPGAMNVIPGEVELGIDIRSICAAAKARVTQKLQESVQTICQRRAIPFDLQVLADETPVSLHASVIGLFEQLCQQKAASFMKLPSGAGHDAMHWAHKAPTGMLFIPCKNGISHNPAESATVSDIAAATEILEAAVTAAAKKDFHWN